MAKYILTLVLSMSPVFWLGPPGQASQAPEKSIPDGLRVSFNGKFVRGPSRADSKVSSENGRFWCKYEIGAAGDEMRELRNLRLYERDKLWFELERPNGSDLYISNCGNIALTDFTHHCGGELTIAFYSKLGERLFSRTFYGAGLFGFSSTGNIFGVGTTEALNFISIPSGRVWKCEKGLQFDISEDENLVAVASENRIRIHANGVMMRDMATNIQYPRRIRVSEVNDIVAVVGKRELQVYSLADGTPFFADRLTGNLSFRDLTLYEGKVVAGIHYRDDAESKGILRVYDLQGTVIQNEEESSRDINVAHKDNPSREFSLEYEELPWPFAPFDSMCTVWNYYEQHMSTGDPEWSYLHQGLDIITPIGEPTYAVQGGYVKCVLTLGGSSYWRIAISPEQVSRYSNGWLYAHLIESTIQFDVGDTVEAFDYLGDIIEWTNDWGHIHFVEIQDSGWVWHYSDNQWGINYNPMLSLTPDTDSIPPVIEDVFRESKFGFCRNETSDYLSPDSLYGDIDIIVKVSDYIGDSPWEQPAYETYYSVVMIPPGDTVFPRTLGQILNHEYDFYDSDDYVPYATTIYKRDEILVPPNWMEMERDYFHILTNNNGDSLNDLSEKELAFATTEYPDGTYRIIVEAWDEFGNSDVDSMDVQFRNLVNEATDDNGTPPTDFGLTGNYPNPFNRETIIRYNLPNDAFVSLTVFDLLGDRVAGLLEEHQSAGQHSVTWNATGLSSGVYFFRIQAGQNVETGKMVLLK